MVKVEVGAVTVGPRIVAAAVGVGAVAVAAFAADWRAGVAFVGAVLAAVALFAEFREWPSSTESGSVSG